MYKILKTFRQDLYILFIISVSLILIMEFFLTNIPEFFYGGVTLGIIILKICYSIMASIIFYFFAIHLKDYKKRNQISPLLNAYFKKLKSIKNVWLSELYFIATIQSKGELDWPGLESLIKDYFPSSEEIKKLAEFTPLNVTRSSDINWVYRIDRLKNQIETLCEEILRLDIYLKANEISLIMELKTCELFSKITVHKFSLDNNKIITNENISFLLPELESFLNLFKKIETEIMLEIDKG